jgi:2,3-dihydroxybiphenyl 1,2-dioxygenase
LIADHARQRQKAEETLMSSVAQLGYVGIEASDLPAWEKFGVDVLGFQLSRKDEDQLVFRMDEYEQRIIVAKGPADDLAFSGWETASEADLQEIVARLTAAGVVVTKASPEETAARRVELLFLCTDPEGNRVELYTGPALTNAPFRSSALRSSFVTGEHGLGHYFLISKKDRQATLEFYIGLLGFKVSDYIRQELAPGFVADAAFLHCNGRHHTMAAALMPAPKHIHHLMIEVADIADVGAAYDRAQDLDAPCEMTLGMHRNDKMFSFYMRTPSGFLIEFGYGGLVVEDATWRVKSFDRLSEWGHRPVTPHGKAA